MPHTGTHARARATPNLPNKNTRSRKVNKRSQKPISSNNGTKSTEMNATKKETFNKKSTGEETHSNAIVQPEGRENQSQDNTESDVTDSGGRDSVMTEIVASPDDNNNPHHDNQTQGDMYSPTPEVVEEAQDFPGTELRPLSNYCEVIDPEDFDSKSFLNALAELTKTLQSDYYKYIDADFSAEDLKTMVSAVSSTMNNFQNYVTYTQKQMEGLRDQMKSIKDKMHRKVQQNAYDPASGNIFNDIFSNIELLFLSFL